MSDGSLLLRVRAYRREETWAPAYVADELDISTREATRHWQDAEVLAAPRRHVSGSWEVSGW